MNRRILLIIIIIIIAFFFAFPGCKNKGIKTPEDNSPTCMDRAIFGDPSQSDYILPYSAGRTHRLVQGYCKRNGSHHNQLAYDFAMPFAEDIIAARGGTVREIQDSFRDDDSIGSHNNYIFIEHDDGTVALYAHLKQFGLLVEPGDVVSAGQVIAQCGNSGQPGDPLLHFGVYGFYPPREGYDVPINFRNADGPLDDRGGLIMGYSYTAR